MKMKGWNLVVALVINVVLALCTAVGEVSYNDNVSNRRLSPGSGFMFVTQLKCYSDQGMMSHYYHFLTNCLLPSVLYYRRLAAGVRETRAIRLCDTMLKYDHLDLERVYSAVLPDVEVGNECLRDSNPIVLQGFDDRHGSGILRLRPDARQILINHFIEATPSNFSQSLRHPSANNSIILIGRSDNIVSTKKGGKTGAARRSIRNFGELHKSLIRAFGESQVRAVFLEEMDIFEQFWLFHHAEIVIGQHGAGLANAIFGGARFNGMIELSPYTWDRKRGLFRAYSECFQYIAQSIDAQYLKVKQEGEFGRVEPNDVVEGVRVMQHHAVAFHSNDTFDNNNISMSTVHRYHHNKSAVSPSFNHFVDYFNSRNHSKGGLNHHNTKNAKSNNNSSKFAAVLSGTSSLHVRDQSVLLDCHLDLEINDPYVFYLSCLFPSILYSLKHWHLRHIGFCGVTMYPYQEMYLRAIIPRFSSCNDRCNVGAVQVPSLMNNKNNEGADKDGGLTDIVGATQFLGAAAHEDDDSILSFRQRNILATYLRSRLHNVVTDGSFGGCGFSETNMSAAATSSACTVLLVDASPTNRTLRTQEPAEPVLPWISNFAELEEALRDKFAEQFAVIRLYRMTVEQRSIFFRRASVVIAHQGPALAHMILGGHNHTTLIQISPGLTTSSTPASGNNPVGGGTVPTRSSNPGGGTVVSSRSNKPGAVTSRSNNPGGSGSKPKSASVRNTNARKLLVRSTSNPKDAEKDDARITADRYGALMRRLGVSVTKFRQDEIGRVDITAILAAVQIQVRIDKVLSENQANTTGIFDGKRKRLRRGGS